MIRENAYDRGMRLLAEHRLRVHRVDEHTIEATCRGDTGETRRLGYRPGLWWCDCPARSQCAHLLALWAVTTRPGAFEVAP